MKKIVVIMMILVIPLITVEKVNNKNYYLETETNTYTKAEIDNKIKELKDKIDSNATNIIETKNILTEIKSKLNDYALKTSLNKTNEDIESLLTLANQNKTRIDELNTSKGILEEYYNLFPIYEKGNQFTDVTGGWVSDGSYGSIVFNDEYIYMNGTNDNQAWVMKLFTNNDIDISQYDGILLISDLINTKTTSMLLNLNYVNQVDLAPNPYYVYNYTIDGLGYSLSTYKYNTIQTFMWNKSVTSKGKFCLTIGGSNEQNIYAIYLVKKKIS